MPVTRADWQGRLLPRTDPEVPLQLLAPLRPAPAGGSGVFLALCADGNEWWMKPVNNPLGGHTLVEEYVVPRVGALIDAPVCTTAIVGIGPGFERYEFVSGYHLEPGLAHASPNIGRDVEDLPYLDYRDRDNNRFRHMGAIALYY
ncbi:MAG: hypothetical protein HY321_10855 [Armatimonadetes bacterium]|nr:hypothetical protein [Armatimonadota bacterium]